MKRNEFEQRKQEKSFSEDLETEAELKSKMDYAGEMQKGEQKKGIFYLETER